MKISTKGRYALRMMVDLAISDEGEFISLRSVAERQAVSMKYMEQIVSQLAKAGFLMSIRGPQGGYKLARKPEQYTVGEILRVTEGGLAPVSCLEIEPNPCPRRDRCSTIEFWEDFYRSIIDFVEGTTLADLVEREQNRMASVEA